MYEAPPVEGPVIVLPGFTWSKSGIGEFVDALGPGVLLADYYGGDSGKGHNLLHQLGVDTPDATDLLAADSLEVIKRNELQDRPLTVVAHSYGALVYARAYEFAKRLGWKSLVPPEGETRDVVLLAPSGSLDNETGPALAVRYLKSFGRLAVKSNWGRAFNDQFKSLAAHPRRRWAEARNLARDRFPYSSLASQGVRVHVVQAYSDNVFPAARYDEALADTPWASRSSVADKLADHNEPLSNPHRTAMIVRQVLRLASPR